MARILASPVRDQPAWALAVLCVRSPFYATSYTRRAAEAQPPSAITPADAHALVAFIVAVANATIANIGAPFSCLVFRFAVSWLRERHPRASAG